MTSDVDVFFARCNEARAFEEDFAVRQAARIEAEKREKKRRNFKGRHRPKQTHCKKGHPFEGNNVKTRTVKGKTERTCRTCFRARKRAGYAWKQARAGKVVKGRCVRG